MNMKESTEKFKVIDNLLIPVNDESYYNGLVDRMANLERLRYYDRRFEREYQSIENEINDRYTAATLSDME